jgi:hypothetical protein
MKGYTTLFLPGCDHASISTQSVIENMLWRRERKTRHDLGREQFTNRALEWKEEYVFPRLLVECDLKARSFILSYCLETIIDAEMLIMRGLVDTIPRLMPFSKG